MFRIFIVGAVSVVALCGAANADVSISSKPTQNMSCDSGVCTATAQKAVLNVSDLQTMLASGDVTVKTGSVTNDIAVVQPLSWTSTARLTLDAQQSVIIKKRVTIDGTGALTITTNDGGSGGDLYFFGGGTVRFADVSSSVIINGTSYTLVRDLKTLAADLSTDRYGHFAPASDYDAKHDKFDTVPIPEFDATLEGLGNSVQHLKVRGGSKCIISHAMCSGMIAINDGLVRDFRLRQVAVNSVNETNVGALAGLNYGLLVNVSVDGSVSGSLDTAYVGGLAGVNEGSIDRSRSSSAVFAPGAHGTAGGMVGLNDYLSCGCTLSVSQSYASGAVSATGVAGGLMGIGGQIHILNSYATGAVSANVAGGLIGNMYHHGGICVGASYSLGSPSGNTNIGGLVGVNDCGKAVRTAYWDTDTSGTDLGCGYAPGGCVQIIGLSDAQLKSALPDGFDPAVWGQNSNINSGYPYLLANPPQ